MKLYYFPGACSLAVHIVLEETGLAYEAQAVDRASRKTAAGEVLDAVNPKGYVPALVLDDGEVLTEGPVINQYLADLVPHRQLAPAPGSRERLRLQIWLNFIGTELHKSFSPLFQGAPEEWKQVMRQKIDTRFEYVERQLQGRRWLTGETFSVADAYLFVMLLWARHLKLPLDCYANLTAYAARVGDRASVRAALNAEGLA